MESTFPAQFRIPNSEFRIPNYSTAATTSTSTRTREFLGNAEKEGQVIPCDGLPKAFVLTAEYGFHQVHLTELGSATLEKRLK